MNTFMSAGGGSASGGKKTATIFLQITVVVLGIGVLIALLWEPHLEGRNVDATVFEIYFKDPFLAFIYIASIPFFVALFQGFKFLGFVRQNTVFSPAGVKALRIIKYCALLLAGAIVAADVYLMIASRTNNEDAAGAVMLGIVATFISLVIAAITATFQGTLQKAVNIKSENELTV